MKDYYSILNVDSDATNEAIKSAFKKLAVLYHPDKNPDQDKAEMTQKFRDVREAYDTLSDSKKRDKYDKEFSQDNLYDNFQKQPQDDKIKWMANLSDKDFEALRTELIERVIDDRSSKEYQRDIKLFSETDQLRKDADQFIDQYEESSAVELHEMLDGYKPEELEVLNTIVTNKLTQTMGEINGLKDSNPDKKDLQSGMQEDMTKIKTLFESKIDETKNEAKQQESESTSSLRPR